MDRRHFLATLGALVPASFLWPLPSFACADSWDSDNFSVSGQFRLLYLAKEGEKGTRLVSLSSSGTAEWTVKLPLASRHSVVVAPGKNPRWAVVPEQDGPKAALVDLHKGSLVKVFTAEEGQWFPGHGIFTPGGETVLLPEFPEDNSRHGALVEYSVPELKLVKRYPTGAYKPHNLVFTRDEKTLVVGHYGRNTGKEGILGDGGAVFLKWPSGEKLSLPSLEAKELALCHVEVDERGGVFVSARSWKGYKNATEQLAPLLFGSLSASEWRDMTPASFKDRFTFNFSLRYRDRGSLLAVNHLKGNMISFWNTKEEKLLSTLDFDSSPLGLEFTPDGKFLLVNTMKGQLHLIDAEARKMVRTVSVRDLGWSPHISVVG